MHGTAHEGDVGCVWVGELSPRTSFAPVAQQQVCGGRGGCLWVPGVEPATESPSVVLFIRGEGGRASQQRARVGGRAEAPAARARCSFSAVCARRVYEQCPDCLFQSIIPMTLLVLPRLIWCARGREQAAGFCLVLNSNCMIPWWPPDPSAGGCVSCWAGHWLRPAFGRMTA